MLSSESVQETARNMAARGRNRKARQAVREPVNRANPKRGARARLEAATVKLIRKQGFRATSVDQIARAAGTTRTTFYQYFKSKSDLIHFLQQSFIAPEMIAISKKLDDIHNPSWDSLREWIVEYSKTWDRVHVFFEAYSEALATDAAVAATAIPNTYWVTGHMTNLLDRFTGSERQRVHDKLVILISVISQMLALTKGQHDDPRNSHLLDNFADLFWDALFSRLPPPRPPAHTAMPKNARFPKNAAQSALYRRRPD